MLGGGIKWRARNGRQFGGFCKMNAGIYRKIAGDGLVDAARLFRRLPFVLRTSRRISKQSDDMTPVCCLPQ
jgi:hypothetical protein